MQIYKNKITKYSAELSKIKQKHTYISIIRLIVFIGIVLSFSVLFTSNHTLGYSLGIGGVALFLWLIKYHKSVEDKKLFIQKLLEVNEQEEQVCNNNYNCFDNGNEFTDTTHQYSYDLDLFGEKSLFQYINRTVTFEGKQLLAKWLTTNKIDIQEVTQRQKAISELADLLDFRQKFLAIGKIHKAEQDDKETINKWLQLPPIFRKQGLIKTLLILIPTINLITLIIILLGLLPLKFLLIQIIANLLLVSIKLKQINQYSVLLSEMNKILKKHRRLLQLIENQTFKTKSLNNLKDKLSINNSSATAQIKQLNKLIDALDNRNNLLVGLVLNSYLLWDWQCVIRIEQWKTKYTNTWLQSISEYDALISLANFEYNNTEFCHPQFNNTEFEFTAKQIGHPLIPNNQRVCNNFSINQHQRFAIITGANMAGKSTFLRSIAINLVLAKAGAVVCAQELIISPTAIFSGMRAEDSLSKNESYFFAELKRLQNITKTLEKGENLFVVLDEILRGTNSEDKRKGSIGFIKKITQYNAFGLIATHDLELAEFAQKQPDIFKTMCFEVKTENNKLQFDYKLSDGITKNMNASFLMKQMGIIE